MAEHSITMEATLEALLKEKKYKTLKDVLITMNPADIAAIFDDLSEAAGSLGATKLGAFFHVVFPLSISGLVTGSVLVFTGCMTAYTTPQLLGGTDTRVLATMIYQYAMSLRDWAQASVVAVVMIVVTMIISGVFNALSRKINPMA